MKKMSEKELRNANGGLQCPYCKKPFLFWFGWEKRYNNHVASCPAKYGNFWVSR